MTEPASAPVDDWTSAHTIDDVIQRMDALADELPPADGVAQFNRMYRQVTVLVRDAVAGQEFAAGDFLERLDVNFANLFFAAHAAARTDKVIPRAWAPLFELRSRPDTLPIQFAFAGMNAHISHDLPFAVVTTCEELGIAPQFGTPQHGDFTETNRVLGEASETIKGWFITGSMARMDQLAGRVDDAFEMLGLHSARAAAWSTAEMLWSLRDHPRMDTMFREGLARTVQVANRGILL